MTMRDRDRCIRCGEWVYERPGLDGAPWIPDECAALLL